MSNQCRFCLEGIEEKSNRLITPCLCNGSCKYIHEECLNKWRLINNINYTQCNTCKYYYKYKKDILIDIYNLIKSKISIISLISLLILHIIYEFLFIKIIKYIGFYNYLYNIIFDYTYIILPTISTINMYYMLKINISRFINNELIIFLYIITLISLISFIMYYFFDNYRYIFIYNIITYTPIFCSTYLYLLLNSRSPLEDLALLSIKMNTFSETCCKKIILKINMIHKVKNYKDE